MNKSAFITLILILFSNLANGANDRSNITMRTHAAPSPDGQKIVFHARGKTMSSTLFMSDANGQNEHHLWGTDSTIEQEPRWSPDGKWIAFVGGKDYKSGSLQLNLISPDGKQHKIVTTIKAGSVKGPSWSPDSQQILFEVRNTKQGTSTLNIFDIHSASVRQLTSENEGMLVQAEWSPDGKAILVAERDPKSQGNSDLWVLSLKHPNHRRQVTKTAEGETMPIWQTNDSIVFSRPMGDSNQHDLFLFNFKDNSEHRLTETESVNEYFPIFSPDKTTLYYDSFQIIDGNYQSTISTMEVRH